MSNIFNWTNISQSIKKTVQTVLLSLLLASAGYAAPKEHSNSIDMDFVLIPAGSFLMGSDGKVVDSRKDETPQHYVALKKAFYLGKYEVTQKQWNRVMGKNPSKFKFGGTNKPVENVSWIDVQDFIKKLNSIEGGNHYRLPTEAEWEYSCRAGTKTDYSFGDDATRIGTFAWYGDGKGNARRKTHPVGQKQANPWGLHDMHGNVLEWVQDVYKRNAYSSYEHRGNNPVYEGAGSFRIIRGGSWLHDAEDLRCTNRNLNKPTSRYHNIGFRLLMELSGLPQ
ncbi:MAG: formylglycine-generating enzyme family protein [Magnetococcales bacterium]|nr:formylglycine-generating enzyme family protein [Magnetococcales bacterium]